MIDLLIIEIEDTFFWGKEKMTSEIQSCLEDEANLRGWAPGYRLSPNPSFQILDSGATIYSFIVQGEYLEIESSENGL